jgi:hypothetical protein
VLTAGLTRSRDPRDHTIWRLFRFFGGEMRFGGAEQDEAAGRVAVAW